MLQAIAIDSDPASLERLNSFCQQLDTLVLIQTFTETSQARLYLRHQPVDLVLMDIQLPTESGVAFWQSIRKQRKGHAELGIQSLPMVIFTTSTREYALVSYELEAIDYLLKPLEFNRFNQAIQRASTYRNGQRVSSPLPAYLAVRVDAGLVRIKLTDIAWVESVSNYLKIYLSDQRFLLVRMTMKAILQELPAHDFVRVHRSYIVPIHRVQAVHNKLIRIGEKQIPLSNHYDEEFVSILRTYQPSSQFLALSSHRQSPLQQTYGIVRTS
ncbi:LytR/AlgR family response regulator transcription factor [Spirosoma gilvum]